MRFISRLAADHPRVMLQKHTDTRSSWARGLSLLPGKRTPTQGSSKAPEAKNEFGLNTLFEPDEPLSIIADYIFIHGLGGGSSTTWGVSSDPSRFWPAEWLPSDADFHGVRIHSFGYNANWSTWSSNPLDVHAFGQSLVEELSSHPGISSQDTPIVLIGHSMGGLVIKKACILAKINPDFAGVSDRFHSFYFLGTPHRGSDLAGTLAKILRISGLGKKAAVNGLSTGSELIRVLNDEFRVHYQGIQLHTFYESLPTGPLGIIVDSQSATMGKSSMAVQQPTSCPTGLTSCRPGYAEERPQLLNAAHRDLAKFPSTEDSNYRSLRNRLAATMRQIKDGAPQKKLPPGPASDHGVVERDFRIDDRAGQIEAIRAYLKIEEAPEDTLSVLGEIRLQGSCSWFTTKATFREWQKPATPRYFWLTGAPACGKSILATHVIEHLGSNPTCYHFFKAGERVATVSAAFCGPWPIKWLGRIRRPAGLCFNCASMARLLTFVTTSLSGIMSS